MSAPAFHVQAPYHLIQVVRLIHALMESSYRVHIPAEHVDKFSRLQAVFGLEFGIGVEGIPALPSVRVSHSEPCTAIGTVERPLIFARAIADRCRASWSAHRSVRFSFVGLVTDQRRAALHHWQQRSYPASARAKLSGLLPRFLRGQNADATAPRADVVIASSTRGREFPGKSWDDEYQALLARSQFVLCPNGDFVWSYRFFEAVFSGAMPIVEQHCDAYQGFRYRTMQDPIDACVWRLEDAEYNYALCRDRLTVQRAELDAAIGALLSHRYQLI
jgi:hypothetical protein